MPADCRGRDGSKVGDSCFTFRGAPCLQPQPLSVCQAYCWPSVDSQEAGRVLRFCDSGCVEGKPSSHQKIATRTPSSVNSWKMSASSNNKQQEVLGTFSQATVKKPRRHGRAQRARNWTEKQAKLQKDKDEGDPAPGQQVNEMGQLYCHQRCSNALPTQNIQPGGPDCPYARVKKPGQGSRLRAKKRAKRQAELEAQKQKDSEDNRASQLNGEDIDMQEQMPQSPVAQITQPASKRRQRFWLALEQVYQLLSKRTLPSTVFQLLVKRTLRVVLIRLACGFCLLYILKHKSIPHFDSTSNMLLICIWNTWNLYCAIRGLIFGRA